MKAKTKYKTLKWITIILTPIYFLSISTIFALLKIDDIWGEMFEIGIENFQQWWTLILYRLLIYVPLPLILGAFVFDKHYKYFSRIIMCYNWMFLIYLIINGIFDILAINMLKNISIFKTLSSFVSIFGYLFTFLNKKTVSFDDVGNILIKTE